MRTVSSGVEEVIRHRVKRTIERYVGAPMTFEVLDAMQAELKQLIATYIGYGEVKPFPLDEILVFTDPSDPTRLLVRIGRDESSREVSCGTMD